MTRLQAATATLRHAWPFSTVPEELVDAAQAGDRLSYYPNTAGAELAPSHQVLAEAKAKVDALAKAGVSDQEKQAMATALGRVWDTPEAKAALADYPSKMARAQAELNDAMGVR